MKRIKKLTLVFGVLGCLNIHYSQSIIDTSLLSINDTIHHYYLFKQNLNLSDEQFINNINSICGLNSDFQCRLISERIDSLKMKHKKFEQTYKGIPIEYSRFIIHSDSNSKIISLTGIIEKNLGNINVNGLISSQDAINYAINYSEKKDFLWLELDSSSAGNSEMVDKGPICKLYIAKQNDLITNKSQNYVVAYKVIINYQDRTARSFYIDAHNGTLIKITNPVWLCFANRLNNNDSNDSDHNLKVSPSGSSNLKVSTSDPCHAICQGGTAILDYYPPQYIYTEKFLYGIVGCRYRLKEICTGIYVYVTYGINDFRDKTNNWTDPEDKKGTTTFFSLTNANAFWKYYLGRNSFDNNYHQVTCELRDMYGAYYLPYNKAIITGTINGYWAGTIDIMAHEFTHGVTDTESQLLGSGESGAIGEGISDIFGTAAEFWVTNYANIGRSPNYDVGEDITSNCGERRSLSNPEYYCSPNTYGAGPYWKDPNNTSQANDFGGIHYNNGVLNKWFYLLSEGGSGINDLNNQYCVQKIGRDNALWILYETIRNYLTPTTNYSQLRYFTELVASQYYGLGENFQNVLAAWYAVGVESSPIYPLYMEIRNKVETTNKNYIYNNGIVISNYTVNPNTIVNVSSAKEIHFSGIDPFYTQPQQPKDIHIKSGSTFHAYIAPGCPGGAKLSNTDTKGNTIQENNYSPTLTNNNITDNNNSITLYPNPTEGLFTLKVSEEYRDIEKTIIITDLLGKVIWQSKNNSHTETTINLSHHQKGIYFVKVITNNGMIMTKKLVVL